MKKRPGAALHSSWNWELISDKTLDWWVPRLGRIKKAFPDRILVASIMAGSGNDTELRHWQELAVACQEQALRRARAEPVVPAHGPPGHGLERRQGQRAGVDRHQGREGSRDDSGVGEADAVDDRHRRRGARRVPRRGRRDRPRRTRSRRCRSSTPRRSNSRSTSTASSPPADSAGRRSCRCRSRRCRSSRRRSRTGSFSGIGGISNFEHALNYFLLGCGTVQVCTAAMLDHAIGPNVIRELNGRAGELPRRARRPRLDAQSTTSSAFAAIASSPSRAFAGRTKKTTAAATRPKATRAEPSTDAGMNPASQAARLTGRWPGSPTRGSVARARHARRARDRPRHRQHHLHLDPGRPAAAERSDARAPLGLGARDVSRASCCCSRSPG